MAFEKMFTKDALSRDSLVNISAALRKTRASSRPVPPPMTNPIFFMLRP